MKVAEDRTVERSYFLWYCSRQQIEEVEAKASKLKEESITTKETLKKALLDFEMLCHEKDEISE